MHQYQGLAIFLVIFVIMPVLLFLALRWVARRCLGARPRSAANAEVTPVGYVFYALQVLFLFLCTVDYHLFPSGHVGKLQHNWDGVLGTIFLSYIGFAVVQLILARLGHPIVRRNVH